MGGQGSRRGGRRPGAGRPKGSGGSPATIRRNPVTVFLRDAEIGRLRRIAREKGLPLGTAAYEILGRALTRLQK